MKIKSIIILLLLLFWMMTNAFGSEVTSREEKSFKMQPNSHITLIGDEGYITVKSWDKNEVHLVMIKHAWARSKRVAEERMKKIEVEIEQTENRLFIREVDYDKGQEFSFWDLLILFSVKDFMPA